MPIINNILIVDDEINILKAFKRNMPTSLHVDYCDNPLEALEMLKKKEYAVVISDINMPQMNGIEFINKVMSTYPDTIRVILTGYANVDYAVEAINKGHVFRFLSKPVHINMLIKVINDSLEQSQNTLARKQLYSLNIQKEQMEAMVNALAKVVELRDPYTSGHQSRVSEMAVKIAKKLGWDNDRTLGLSLASMVHDIGKIYVPAEFLNKPGKLTDTEFVIIKQHPSIGHEILSVADFKWPIADIVLQHHEKYDGKGYPNNLKGDEIMDEAQIISVSDVYDAMCNRRPYREGLGEKTAIEFIKSVSGTSFKSEIVDAFLDIINH